MKKTIKKTAKKEVTSIVRSYLADINIHISNTESDFEMAKVRLTRAKKQLRALQTIIK